MAFDAHSNELEIAWAAGLFEGEGCIVASRKNRDNSGRYVRLQMVLGSTDRDIVERYARIVGASRPLTTRERPEHPNHRTMHYSYIYGKECLPVIEMFLPFLGERRRAKALEALALGSELGLANGAKTHCPQGHEYNTENTYNWHSQRRCRACWRIQNQKRKEARVAALVR